MSSVKKSYTLPCSTVFRDSVLALAGRRRVNAGDLARSVMLVVPEDDISAYPDPGGPPPDDREPVVLKSGAQEGRPWRRKPRLQVRLPDGLNTIFIRQALALALAFDRGERGVDIKDPQAPPPSPPPAPVKMVNQSVLEDAEARIASLQDEIERLRTVFSVISVDTLPEGVRTRSEALHVLGFPPDTRPDRHELRARFRVLATIYHPDSAYGSHSRMAQINTAMDVLRSGP